MSDEEFTLAERVQGAAGRALGRLPARAQLRLSGRPQVEADGQLFDPCLQLVLAASRRRARYGLCEPDPPAARARFRREVLLFAGAKTRVGDVRGVEVGGEAGPLRARLYTPPEPSEDLLVYLHGGGFVIGDLETHDEPCRLLCLHARTRVLSVEYRLAPEHRFPAGLHDARAALRWAQENAASLGADPARVSIGGDSAGGNLAAGAARLARRDRPPAAQLLIYPATDTAATDYPSKELFGRGYFLARKDCDDFFRHYTEGAGVADDDPRVAPVRAPDFEGLAPALVVIAGFDVLRDEGDAYVRKLEGARVPVVRLPFPSLAHGFANMTGVCPSAREALADVARAWRALIDEAPAPRA